MIGYLSWGRADQSRSSSRCRSYTGCHSDSLVAPTQPAQNTCSCRSRRSARTEAQSELRAKETEIQWAFRKTHLDVVSSSCCGVKRLCTALHCGASKHIWSCLTLSGQKWVSQSVLICSNMMQHSWIQLCISHICEQSSVIKPQLVYFCCKKAEVHDLEPNVFWGTE